MFKMLYITIVVKANYDVLLMYMKYISYHDYHNSVYIPLENTYMKYILFSYPSDFRIWQFSQT